MKSEPDCPQDALPFTGTGFHRGRPRTEDVRIMGEKWMANAIDDPLLRPQRRAVAQADRYQQADR